MHDQNEILIRVRDYVENVLFADSIPPPPSRRQYYPSKACIKEFLNRGASALTIKAAAASKLQDLVNKLRIDFPDDYFYCNFLDPDSKNTESPKSENLDVLSQELDERMLEQNEATSKVDGAVLKCKENSGVIFCHQTQQQQRLLKRYGSKLFMIQIDEIYCTIPFPLLCLYVQTNVDFQIVGFFVLYGEKVEMVSSALNILRQWNPNWSPNYVLCDSSDCQIDAVEKVFPSK